MEIATDTNLMQFNKGKCKVFHLGRDNPRHQYKPGENWQESDFAEKDLRVPEDKLNVNQQQALATKMANSILGFVRRSVPTRSRGMILPLFSVTPQLEDGLQFRAPQYKRDSGYQRESGKGPQG